MKIVVSLAALLIALPALAATYTYTGPIFTGQTDHTTCDQGGPCANYNQITMHVTGSFTTAAPIAQNQSNLDISAAITSYSFTDGVNTIASGDTSARIHTAQVTTNGAGAITAWTIFVEQWITGVPAGPHTFGTSLVSTSPQSLDRLNTIRTDSTPQDSGFHNETCHSALGAGDVCTGFSQTSDASFATAFSLGSWSASGVSFGTVSTPTLSTWSVLILAVFVMVAALWTLRKKRSGVL